MTTKIIRIACIVVITLSAILGLYTVKFYSTDNSDLGIRMVCLLYEYDNIEEISQRRGRIKSLCSKDAYEQISISNPEHYANAYSLRTQNYQSIVRVVFDRPGLVVYALDNAVVYPTDLWCFEYKIKNGLFTDIREYKLAGWREDSGGGLF